MAAPPLFWTEADGARHGYEPARGAAPSPRRSASSCAGSSASGPTSRGPSPTASATASGAARRSRPSASALPLHAPLRASSTSRSSCARATPRRGRARPARPPRRRDRGQHQHGAGRDVPGRRVRAFDGVSDDVFGDMLRALQAGEVDAVVDDDVAFIGIERTYPGIRVAFTVATRNPWGCALRLGDDELKRRARRRHRAGRPAGGLAPLAAVAALPALTSDSAELAVEVLEPRAAAHDQARRADRAPCRSRGTRPRRRAPCC